MQGLQQPGCHWRSCHLWKGGRLGLQRQVRLIHPMPASGPRLPLGPQLWGRWRSSRVRRHQTFPLRVLALLLGPPGHGV